MRKIAMAGNRGRKQARCAMRSRSRLFEDALPGQSSRLECCDQHKRAPTVAQNNTKAQQGAGTHRQQETKDRTPGRQRGVRSQRKKNSCSCPQTAPGLQSLDSGAREGIQIVRKLSQRHCCGREVVGTDVLTAAAFNAAPVVQLTLSNQDSSSDKAVDTQDTSHDNWDDVLHNLSWVHDTCKFETAKQTQSAVSQRSLRPDGNC